MTRNPFPRFQFFALCALIVGIVWFAIAFLGAIHHQRFSGYYPSSEAVVTSESNFTPYISPRFSRSTRPLHETVIPYLFYRSSSPDREPRIFLKKEDITLTHGYKAKRSVTIESLIVLNGSGEEFALITPPSQRTFSLSDRLIFESVDLGAVQGDILELFVTGFVVTDAGEKKRFSFSQRWKTDFSTRTVLGISIAE